MTMSELAGARTLARSASAIQLRAVYGAMKVLVEDDRARDSGEEALIPCFACRRDRPAAGSVAYDGRRLCNGCATDFEVLRIAGLVADLDAYLHRPHADPTAG